MCLTNYKGIIRGAFALAISYLENTTLDKCDRGIRENMIAKYLQDNGVIANFDEPQNKAMVTKIVRAGESVYFDNESMDSALATLSRGLHLKL